MFNITEKRKRKRKRKCFILIDKTRQNDIVFINREFAIGYDNHKIVDLISSNTIVSRALLAKLSSQTLI